MLETIFPEIKTLSLDGEPVKPDVTEEIVTEEVDKVETETTETTTTTDTTETETESENLYEQKLNELYSEGILGLDELPEEFKDKVFGPEETISLLEYALKNKETSFNSKVEEIKKETFNEIYEGMSEITRKAYEFESVSQDPEEIKEFLKGLVFQQDILSLNPQKDAESILMEWNKANGMSKEESLEAIEDLKTLNKLEKKANEVKPLLDKKVTEIAEKKLKEQNDILLLEKQAKDGVKSRLNTLLSKNEIDGIKLDDTHKTFLMKVLAEDEIEVPYRGKSISVSGAEYLTMYHRFSEKGNLAHLAKAFLFLQFPDVFEKQYVSKVQQSETNKFIKDHKVSGGIKTGLFVEKEKQSVSKNKMPL